jgi:hypothetical protein
MFTWICPQCGREVPPAYNDCPDCSKKNAADGVAAAASPNEPAQLGAQQPAQDASPGPPAQPGSQFYPPQRQPAQPPPGYHYVPPQSPQAVAAPSRGVNLPVWLMTILFALGIAGVVFGTIWLLGNRGAASRGSAGNGPAPTAVVESPAAKPGAKTSSLQKYIEISGVRFAQEGKKAATVVKFVIVNHSEGEITGLAGNVTIWGRTQKSEEDAQGTFSFSTSLAPLESKELSAPLTTKRKIYELADWQNITTDVQITAPAGGA